MYNSKPFFFDSTLRDGNQSLRKPWDLKEKELVFRLLMELGVQGVEAGFAGSSEMDFDACQYLAEIANESTVVCSLARTVERDITIAADAIKNAKKPRIHTFVTLSPFNMKYVLQKDPDDVRKIAIDAVRYARSLMGERGEVQFSAEHFGDCLDNMPFVIDTLQDVVSAGANVINLPNTVERTRPMDFVKRVIQVVNELPKEVTIAVHCHNDLGMATATTVESFFAGAKQLEVCLNGLGERAGNTNLYEVAIALHNSGIDVPLDLSKIYETALTISEKAGVKIYEKSPLIGPEALAHRSGIHQDGALKTKDMEKGAYRPIHPSLIGRDDDEKLGFTSQSGKTAVFEIVSRAGYHITMEEAIRITPAIKEAAEKVGELPTRNIIDIYFKEVFKVKGPFALENFTRLAEDKFKLEFKHFDKRYNITAEGNGPLSCCLNALEKAGFKQNLVHYEQQAMDEEIKGSGADAMTVIKLEAPDKTVITCRGLHTSTAKANVIAIFNGLNLIAGMKK
ncbi:MAG: alpha-isopropylmalate synthase regulatory domain-containing protein [Candidatus Gastranaerophilales bacterium]|nr:alpha-isopropylmalate synthase regulatory domain-containing protein [Candidatus Gastranaerophilales bacterium]